MHVTPLRLPFFPGWLTRQLPRSPGSYNGKMLSNHGPFCQHSSRNISVKLCRFAQPLQHVSYCIPEYPYVRPYFRTLTTPEERCSRTCGKTAGLSVSLQCQLVRRLTHSCGMQWKVHILLHEHCGLPKENITKRIHYSLDEYFQVL